MQLFTDFQCNTKTHIIKVIMQFLLIISSEFLKFIIMLSYIQEDYCGLFFYYETMFEKFERLLVDYLLLWLYGNMNFMFDPQFESISLNYLRSLI